MSHNHDAPHQRLGGKLGPRLAAIWSQSAADHLRRTSFVQSRIHAEGLNEFFRGMSREKYQFTSPLWALFLQDEELPPELKSALHFIAHGTGELSEVMGSLGMGNVVGTSILSSIQNFLAPTNQRLIATQPNTLIDPPSLAALVARGWMDEEAAKAEAARGGINPTRFRHLHRLAENYPSLGEALELWRRNEITEVQAAQLLERNGVAGEYIPALLSLKQVHLAPADAALATLRGIITEVQGAEIALNSGITPSDFKVLVQNTGEPPGLMQLLDAFRRGFIDKGRLDKGIKQSRVRDEWADVVEKLRFSPASTSDALRGVIQGHLSHEKGKEIAEDNGQRPEDWDWMVETEGNPPGTMQMLELYNRGHMTAQQVEQGIKESRLKNKYIATVRKLAVKLPEGRQITTMISRGALSHARGMELLRDHGYEKDVAEALLDSALSGQTLREKQLAQGTITALYESHALTREKAKAYIEVLGYHSASADMLLTLADLKREHALQNAALAPVKSAYIGRHIEKAEASADIDKIGIPASQRDYLLALWTIERSSHRKSLTEAQIIKANTMNLFNDPVAIARLEKLGYSSEDAKVLMDMEKNRSTPA